MKTLVGVALGTCLGAVITPLVHDGLMGTTDKMERESDIKVGAVVGGVLAIITWPLWRRR